MGDRPCYYLRERGRYVRENGERVLIPNCMGALHSNDIRDCTCDRTEYRRTLEERMDAMEQEIKALRAALAKR